MTEGLLDSPKFESATPARNWDSLQQSLETKHFRLLTVKPQTTEVSARRKASRRTPLIVYSCWLFIGSLKSYKDFIMILIVGAKVYLNRLFKSHFQTQKTRPYISSKGLFQAICCSAVLSAGSAAVETGLIILHTCCQVTQPAAPRAFHLHSPHPQRLFSAVPVRAWSLRPSGVTLK